MFCGRSFSIPHRRSSTSAKQTLGFETLELRNLLTTFLVDFNGGGGGIAPVDAADFAVADPNVDLTATVHSLTTGNATGLAGTNGVEFDLIDSGGASFTTNKGTYVNQPILDAYLFINNSSRTVSVSSLEEIAAGQTLTITLYGVGDNPNQDTRFTLNYDGSAIGTADTNYDSGNLEDTYVTFNIVKQAGVDQFEVVFQNNGTGSATGALNGLSITAPNNVRINAGGDAHVDSEGNQFLADQYFSVPSDTSSVVGTDIFIPGTGGTTANDEDVDDILYQTDRFAQELNYEIPVANGFYSLKLHYSENFFTDVNQRIFDVIAEGQLISDNLDIFEARQNAFTPGNFAALVQEFNLIEVTDGSFSLELESLGPDGLNNAKVAAIEVIRVETPQLAIFPTGTDTTVVENGATDSYGLALTVAPQSDVTVTLNTGGEVAASESVLTFTPENFATTQFVTLTAVNDDDKEGTQTINVSHSLASSDPVYDGQVGPELTVVVLDDDVIEVNFDKRTLASVSGQNPTTGAFGPDGRLYIATQSGQIRAYTFDDQYNVLATQAINTIANQPNPRTILGIAFNPFEQVSPGQTPTLYVSRSSLFDSTEQYISRVSTLTGASFNTITDIITGLPVSGFDHGVNGLQFDENGDLLIAIGGNTNTGEFDGVFGSQAPESPLTSAILRARITEPTFNGAIDYEFIDPNDPDLLQLAIEENDPNPSPNDQRYGNFVQVVDQPGEIEVETFAVGLRNPYDLVFTSDSLIFATDNGPNGIAEDELNLVSEGDFLGHPSIPRSQFDPRQALANAIYNPSVPSNADYTAPLVALPSSTNGIDEYRAETFDGQLRGQLFAQRFNGEVFFFQRTTDGLDIENTNTFFDIADGLDILAGPGGVIFGIDRNDNEVSIAEPVDSAVSQATPYDIFPFRAPAIGGNQFVIGGTNFGSAGNTTVYIGGHQAEILTVEPGRITGVFPAMVASDDLQDVVVTTSGASQTIEDAFLPLGDGLLVTPTAQGDYNDDGVVNLADYTVWRDNLGSTTNLDANGHDAGDSAGVVDTADYAFWRLNFGNAVLPPAAASVSLASASAESTAIEPLVDNAFAAYVSPEVGKKAQDGDESSSAPESRVAVRDDLLLLARDVATRSNSDESQAGDAESSASEAGTEDDGLSIVFDFAAE